jgi:hypothetical protein
MFNSLLSAFMGLLALLGMFGSIFVVGYSLNWVLGPLDRAAKNRRYRVQFSLADFLCLFVEVQLALGVLALAFRGTDGKMTGLAVFLSIVILAVVSLVWWTGVRTLSAGGIDGTFARALTLSIGIPIGFAGSIAIPAIAVAAFASLDSSNQLPRIGFFLLLALVDALIIFALGHMTRHIVARSKRQQDAIHPRSPEDGSINATSSVPSQ